MSGNFTIINNRLNYLNNLSTLTFTSEIPDYISQHGTGLTFTRQGVYSLQSTFSMNTINSNGEFNIYTLICFNSSESSPYPLTYNGISGKLTGPQYTKYSTITYCVDRENKQGGVAVAKRYSQIAEGNVNTSWPPIVEFQYPCKSNSSYLCYSNYYTFSYILVIQDDKVGVPLYIQTAFDGAGSYMTGSGNFVISYVGVWD